MNLKHHNYNAIYKIIKAEQLIPQHSDKFPKCIIYSFDKNVK